MTSDGTLLFVDAIEGDYARLLLGNAAFSVPVRILPEGVKEGSWIRLSLQLAAAPSDDADALRRELGRRDRGGDIKL